VAFARRFDDGLGSETSPEVLDVLETMPPGPFLGILLAGVNPATLSELDRTRFLQAQARMVAHHQARLLEAMVAVHDAAADHLDDDIMKDAHAAEDAAAEIAVALHLTRRAADRDLHTALGLRRRLPQVLDALASGTLDRRRAGVILRDTDHLPIAEARQVTHQIVDKAAGWTTGQLRARLRRLCMQVDSDAAADRYRQALTRRRVVLRGTEEGTAHLGGFDLPPGRAAEARDRIEALARRLRRDGETRSLDQLRADVYLDLLCGTLPTPADRTRGGIHITVDLPTLAGMVDTCGELDGFGPIVADVARQITLNHTDDTWTWAVTHPDTGAVLADGTTRRRPTTRQRRHLTTRRRTCCFPGCRMPAIDCDLDHTVPWAHGGRTRCANLGPLCRHHHRLHHRGWHYIIDPDGRIHWTSPLGQTTTVHPDGQSRPPP